jgi:hypothetical protein
MERDVNFIVKYGDFRLTHAVSGRLLISRACTCVCYYVENRLRARFRRDNGLVVSDAYQPNDVVLQQQQQVPTHKRLTMI